MDDLNPGGLACSPRGCAIYSPGIPARRSNPFGKDVANTGLWSALVRHSGLEELCFALNRDFDADALRQILVGDKPTATRVTTTNIFDTAAISRMGTLLRGSADLADLAWLRGQNGPASDFSLVGLIHTIAPPAVRQYIGQCAVAPVHAWDALICTSPVVRQNIFEMFEAWNEYLRARFHGDAGPRMPMLPVIPLGVDTAEIAAAADRPEVRKELRARLLIGDDDIVVLWLGRLSFFEKAFPQPMFAAIEEAHRLTGRPMHFAMLGWFPDQQSDRRRYEEAARIHAPSVSVHFLDGNDQVLVNSMWAAADIFLSLVDNIQETFGITILEAMAAGLPVVASDWDGYRASIQHGQQGFLVPTLGGPPGLGAEILWRHVSALDSYQRYVGILAQCTAVRIGKAAEAISVLTREPALRHKMGTAGRHRVRTLFDWAVVAHQFAQLFGELRDIRSRNASPEATLRGNPVKSEPFSTFAAFATGVLHDDTVLWAPAGTGISPSIAFSAELNRFGVQWRAELSEIEAVYQLLRRSGELTVGDILSRCPSNRRAAVQASLLWMCKLGIADWH
jgi:glycosyltransferase involved in cell wall biosynthesis